MAFRIATAVVVATIGIGTALLTRSQPTADQDPTSAEPPLEVAA